MTASFPQKRREFDPLTYDTAGYLTTEVFPGVATGLAQLAAGGARLFSIWNASKIWLPSSPHQPQRRPASPDFPACISGRLAKSRQMANIAILAILEMKA